MAFDFSKLNFFSRLDARARVFVLLGAVFGAIFLIYIATKFLGGGAGALGPSSVAGAPQGLQSVPGGTQTQQFSKAVEQANMQREQAAKISGSSSVPTLVNLQQPSGQNQCIICSDQSIDVKNTLDEWVQKGKVSPETAKILSSMAAQNVSPQEFEAQLNQLVASGKLTPEQARFLLEQYKKQYANKLLQESAAVMDDLIKRGQLPLDTANQLLAAQKAGASTAEYSDKLQKAVKENRISPATAQTLLTQYTQQQARQATAAGIASLRKMTTSGEITPESAKELEDLQARNVSVDMYKQTLDKMVADGKITPAVAKRLLDEYAKQKAVVGPIVVANQMLQKSEKAAYDEITELVNDKRLTPEVGAQLTTLIQNNIPLNDYRDQLTTLVQQNKVPPDIAKLKYDDYKEVTGLRAATAQLAELQGNKASLADYEAALRGLVQKGAITPDQAAQLMQEYQAFKAQAPVASAPLAAGAGSEAFAKLQERLQNNTASTDQPLIGAEQFAVAQAQSEVATGQATQEKIQEQMALMSGQAQQLIAAWQPVPMSHKEGSFEKDKPKAAGAANAAGGAGKDGGAADSAMNAPSLIKAGSILFAVLDTAVNSDYPDSPVMATVVDGKYKGAKLMGKLITTKGVSGQMDRVSLNFTLMNVDAWPKSKGVTAYAIDPDTAKTVLASNVNYHYLQRFGAIMATSFVQGYANAISSSASTTTTGIFGTSTTHPELSASQKLATAVGQIGTALGSVTQNYTNIPPTVKVDSGVGLGILFMSDVS